MEKETKDKTKEYGKQKERNQKLLKKKETLMKRKISKKENKRELPKKKH